LAEPVYVETPDETLELPGQAEEEEAAFGATGISRHNETVVFDITIPPKQGEMVLDRGWLLGQLEEREDQKQVAIIGELPQQKMVVGMWVDGLLEVIRREFPERYVSWLKPMVTTEPPQTESGLRPQTESGLRPDLPAVDPEAIEAAGGPYGLAHRPAPESEEAE